MSTKLQPDKKKPAVKKRVAKKRPIAVDMPPPKTPVRLKHISPADQEFRPQWGEILAEMIRMPDTITIVESYADKLSLDRAARRYRKRDDNGEIVKKKGKAIVTPLPLWTRKIGKDRFVLRLRLPEHGDKNPLDFIRPAGRYGAIKAAAFKLQADRFLDLMQKESINVVMNAFRHYFPEEKALPYGVQTTDAGWRIELPPLGSIT